MTDDDETTFDNNAVAFRADPALVLPVRRPDALSLLAHTFLDTNTPRGGLRFGATASEEQERARRERHAAEVERWHPYAEFRAALTATSPEGLAASTLDLHFPVGIHDDVADWHCNECSGCCDSERWPCDTVRLVADAAGVAHDHLSSY